MEKNMPMNILELDRFLRILHFSKIPISREELIVLAQSQNLYKRYTKVQFQKIDHKTIAREDDRELEKDVEWSYEAVFYDKFLKYCRNTFLDDTERDKVIEQCYLTVKNFDEDILKDRLNKLEENEKKYRE